MTSTFFAAHSAVVLGKLGSSLNFYKNIFGQLPNDQVKGLAHIIAEVDMINLIVWTWSIILKQYTYNSVIIYKKYRAHKYPT
jgi:hypothetical protein